MLERCTNADFNDIYDIINDAASAYKGVIPADRWHEPYMSKDELKTQIKQGVEFWCYKEGDRILGVMGIQDKGRRHSYPACLCSYGSKEQGHRWQAPRQPRNID
jgi:hypothetical protein